MDSAAPLHHVFSALADLPEAEWQHFRTYVREQHFQAGEYLMREQHDGTTLHFIVAGLVRIFHQGDGVELVRGFDFENRFSGVYESVLTGEPSPFSIQALEPSHTLAFPGEILKAMYDRHPAWDRIGRLILEQQWLRGRDKEMRFRLYSAEEHYRLLIARNSPLLKRVPLRHLASYLRVTPETLSRIRARLRSEAGPGKAEIRPANSPVAPGLDFDQCPDPRPNAD
jgi:CRP-like cAMP-binding protein